MPVFWERLEWHSLPNWNPSIHFWSSLRFFYPQYLSFVSSKRSPLFFSFHCNTLKSFQANQGLFKVLWWRLLSVVTAEEIWPSVVRRPNNGERHQQLSSDQLLLISSGCYHHDNQSGWPVWIMVINWAIFFAVTARSSPIWPVHSSVLTHHPPSHLVGGGFPKYIWVINCWSFS